MQRTMEGGRGQSDFIRKDKTIVVDLAGKFPTADHHVRIRTNMQIYWDQAFVARDLTNGPAKVTTLAPLSADLHFRGFSRMYRKGGRHGPYWFDYDVVAKESPWRPIEGAFTRFGNVSTLLGNPDDMYVIMAPGGRRGAVRRQLRELTAGGLEARLFALHRRVDQGLRPQHRVRHDRRATPVSRSQRVPVRSR